MSMTDSNSPLRKRQRVTSPERTDTTQLHALARWCSWAGVGPDNQQIHVQWDKTKIKSFLSEEELGDSEAMRRLLDGSGSDIALASRFHPLIFDHDSSSNSKARRLRSLPFLKALASGGSESETQNEYNRLDPGEKRLVGLAIRDLFLASTRGLLEYGEDEELLRKVVEAVDDTVGCVSLRGMTVSFYPSASFKMAKFVEGLESFLEEKEKYFAQVMDTPKLYMVFVDPRELSYHNFENIVPIDSWIEAQTEAAAAALATRLGNVAEVQPGVDIWTAKLQGPETSTELIKRLSNLDLYVSPLNKTTRGGKRFIFHSTHLSKALTAAVTESGLITQLAGGKFANSEFAFVNYVFRCNHFTPDDAKFSTHRDTPYFDGMRRQVSRYTLLLYLSEGSNERGVLSINTDTNNEANEVTFNEIEAFTCIVFDQKHEHQGYPFISTDKNFLRTELVFNINDDDGNISHGHTQIASLFSEACYMLGQSIFDKDLEKNAHECFERANSLHWNTSTPSKPGAPASVYLYKQYKGFRFLTNGYNYWFSRPKGCEPRSGTESKSGTRPKAEESLIDCAMLAVLDYFNVKLGGSPFRSMCRSTTVRETIASTAGAFRIISPREATPEDESADLSDSSSKLRRLTEDVLDDLLKPTPEKPFTPRPKPSWEDEDDSDDDDEDGIEPCCPFHTWTTFNAFASEEVTAEYSRCIRYTRNRLFGVPLVFLGREIVLNEGLVKVVGDKILFFTPPPNSNSDSSSEVEEQMRFNFAACWGDGGIGPEVFIDTDETASIPAPKLLLPPITYHEYPGEEQGYHFVVDFWRNDWMVEIHDSPHDTVPVPKITNEVPEEWEDKDIGGRFWQKVKSLVGDDEKALGGTFWSRDSDDEEEE